MLRKLGKTLVIVLSLMAVSASVAWLLSYQSPFQETWSDPAQQECGRVVSADGRLFWQSCQLRSTRAVQDPILKWRLAQPADFVVGTGQAGERVMIFCGQHSVPFVFPDSRYFLGLTTKIEDAGYPATKTRWACEWHETTLAYGFVVVVVGLVPAAAFIQCVRSWIGGGGRVGR